MFRVNVLTGELCLTISDLYLPGVLPVTLQRSYCSTSQYQGALGLAWSHPYSISLDHDGTALVLRRGGDELHRFEDVGTIRTVREDGQYLLIPAEASEWAVVSKAESLSYHFRASHRTMPVAAIVDLHHNQIAFEYDSHGRLLALTDPTGRRLEFSYVGLLLERLVMASHAGRPVNRLIIECGYDKEGNLTWTRDSKDAEHRYAYHKRRLVAYTNPLGGVSCAQFDEDGRCVRTWERDGKRMRQLSYDSLRRVTKVTDSEGYSTIYRFDEKGALAEKVDPLHGVTKYVRDEGSALMAVINPLDETSVFYHSEQEGRRACKTDPSGATTAVELDAQGRVIALVDACGSRWEYVRDDRGSITESRTPTGYAWKYHYDTRGEVAAVTDPNGWETTYHRRDDGLGLTARDQLGVVFTKEFDSFGRLIAYREGKGPELRVSHEGLVQRVTNVDGSVQLYEFNPIGGLMRFVDELGKVWRFRYDRYGRIMSRTDPLGHQLSWECDAEARVAAVINESGERFETFRDPLARIVKQVSFDGCARTYHYDPAGRLVGRTDGNGTYVALECDPVGRPVARHYPDGSCARNVRDPLGRMIASEDPYGLLELAFDSEGRLVSESDGEAQVSYDYDWRPVPTCLRSGSRELRFAYGERGNLRSITEGEELAAHFAYDEEPATQTIQFRGGLCVRREYDVRNRLVRQVVLSSRGSVLLTDEYTYDPTGNLTEKRREGGEKLSFSHNARDELVEVRREGLSVCQLAYDPMGNCAEQNGLPRAYERGNRLQRSPDGAYTYDGEGRPLTRQTSTGSTGFSYDLLGRLAEVRLADGGKVNFLYDALFRRKKKVGHDGARETVWAGDTPLQEHLPDGTPVKYVFHPIDQTPLALAVNGEWYCVVVDFRGEVTDLIRMADEAVAWSADALGFAADVRLDGLSERMALRGPGQILDRETGLAYQRTRYYDPGEGRFLTPDPVGVFGGWNLYRFCLNQPFRLIDPLGLAPCPLSEQECDDLYQDIQTRKESVKQRWEEMENPTDILPWQGAPKVRQLYAAAAVSADGTTIPAGTKSKGSVDTHLKNYDEEQGGLAKQTQKYYEGGCVKHEDSARAAGMQDAATWTTKPPSLPKYGL